MLDDVRSTNPVLKNLAGDEQQAGYGSPSQAEGYAPEVSQDRPLTVDDVVTKTGITLGVIILASVLPVIIEIVGKRRAASDKE